MVFTALEKAAIALKSYEQWRDDLNGGTTTNEDRLAEALREVIEERKRFEGALYEVRDDLESGFGHRRTTSEGAAVRSAQEKISEVLSR